MEYFLCRYVLSPDFLSPLHLVRGSFYLTKAPPPKKKISFLGLLFVKSWLCCKGELSAAGSARWIPGQHSVCFCLKESSEISPLPSEATNSRFN